MCICVYIYVYIHTHVYVVRERERCQGNKEVAAMIVGTGLACLKSVVRLERKITSRLEFMCLAKAAVHKRIFPTSTRKIQA